MPRPQTSVDRFLAREGWHYAGWSVTRAMVRMHDKIGWAALLAAPVVASLMAFSGDPSLTVLGLPFATIGAAELTIYHWVRRNPDIKEETAPKLSPNARRFLRRLVKNVVGTDPLGPKFMGRILRPSASEVKHSAKELINPLAYECFEIATEAYNRLVGLCAADPDNSRHILKTAHEAMPIILDHVTRLDAFPEQHSSIAPRINQLVNQLNSIATSIELPKSESETRLSERIEALSDLNLESENPDQQTLSDRA